MAIKRQLYIGGLLCLVAFTISTKDHSFAKFTRFRCIVYDRVLITNASCTLKLINRNLNIVNLYGYLNQQVNVFMVHLQVFKKMNHVFKPFLVDVRENFCNLFTKTTGAIYLRVLLNIAGANSNLNHSCPYKGPVFIKDLPMDASKLPLLWPAGEYRVNLSALANGSSKPCVTIQTTLEFQDIPFQ